MQNTRTIAQEQSGARWIIRHEGGTGPRAYWVFLVSGISVAKPGTVGFYAPNFNAACEALSN